MQQASIPDSRLSKLEHEPDWHIAKTAGKKPQRLYLDSCDASFEQAQHPLSAQSRLDDCSPEGRHFL